MENPLLRLPAGRMVEIVFRNEDTGARHNLAVEDLDVATPLLEADESAVLRFTRPQRDACPLLLRLHPVLM